MNKAGLLFLIILAGVAMVQGEDRRGVFFSANIAGVQMDEAFFDDTQLGWSGALGWRFSPFFSISGGFQQAKELQQEVAGRSLGFRYKTWFFGPTLHLELRSRLELTGGLHLLRSSVEQRQDAIELLSAWDTGFGASLGVTYHVTGNWATTLHWDRLQLDDWYIDTLQAGFVLRP